MIGVELKKYLVNLGYKETILVDYFVNDPEESLSLNNHIIIESRPSNRVDFRDRVIELPFSIFVRKSLNSEVQTTATKLYNDLMDFNGYLDSTNFQFRVINTLTYPPYKYGSLKNLHISLVRVDFQVVDNNRGNY